MITFQECQVAGYKARTIENATADLTIAFAVDFKTPGEICTKNAVLKNHKIYCPIGIKELIYDTKIVQDICSFIGDNIVITINIAGNGIYTLAKYSYTQDFVDNLILEFLTKLLYSQRFKARVYSIRSGGQTGIDEAGVKAAVKLGIPALVLAPKGWLFRDITGKDIYDEYLFKNRFNLQS